MSLWVCERCTCRYAVGLARCPQCGSTDYQEDSAMGKISKTGAASERSAPAVAPDVATDAAPVTAEPAPVVAEPVKAATQTPAPPPATPPPAPKAKPAPPPAPAKVPDGG